jgi:hypothetical protein
MAMQGDTVRRAGGSEQVMSVDGQRLDSRLEAEGAEFLVLAHLLIEGIQAMKAYTRFPGYDLVATRPEAGTACRIQVKSRFATDYNRVFPFKNVDCDFGVLVALNRGYRYGRKHRVDENAKRPPELYVFPIDILRKIIIVSGGFSKVRLADIPDVDDYRDRWDLIRTHLRMPISATVAG